MKEHNDRVNAERKGEKKKAMTLVSLERLHRW